MPLSLFGYTPKSRAEDSIGTTSEHLHTFGGHFHDFEISSKNAPMPLHLIYRLDLRDPLVPVSIPKTDFLPLLQCFRYGTECSYLVHSDTEIELISPGEQEYYFPPWEAPESFPRQTTSFTPKPFDPLNANDVMDWKGVFGWDELTGEERKRALIMARERSWLTEEDCVDEDWTYEDKIGCMYHPPFAQASPNNSCSNPDCSNDRLQVIALQDEAVSAELIWPDEYVQTIWELCRSCHSITVTNQCT